MSIGLSSGDNVKELAALAGQLDKWLDSNPSEVGWYATLRCWDAQEGIFPSGCYWNGLAWDKNAVIQYWPVVFTDEQAADNFAHEHDPDQ